MKIDLALGYGGLGDDFMLLWIAETLRRRSHKVSLYAHRSLYIKPFWKAVKDVQKFPRSKKKLMVSPVEMWTKEAEGMTRMQALCSKLPKKLAPLTTLRRPECKISLKDQTDLEDYVVFAPFSAWANREWNQHHWRQLSTFLYNATGKRPVIIGTNDRLSDMKDFTGCRYYYNLPPEKLYPLLANAKAVVGNDSGPVHMAGTLGVNTLVLTAAFFRLWDHYGTVFEVQAKGDCVNCKFQRDRGYQDRCMAGCNQLRHNLKPERAFIELAKLL